MNRRSKSFLSVFLSAAIAAGTMPVTASADNAEVKTDNEAVVAAVAEPAAVEAVAEEAPAASALPVLTPEEILELATTAANGNCGPADGSTGEPTSTATWAYDGNGTLTISGTGNMIGYESSAAAYDSPWRSYATVVTKIVINDGITSVGGFAFNEFSALTQVTLPASLVTIEESAFYGCDALRTCNLSATKLSNIGASAFSGCKALSSAALPTSIQIIGEYAFSDCQAITDVTVPASVTTLGKGVFAGCIAVKKGTVSSTSITAIPDEMFTGCSSMTEVTIPTGVTAIGTDAFSGCTNLITVNGESMNIIVPSSVTEIGTRAFSGCKGFTGVDIKSNVTYVGINAFSNCTNLKTLKVDGAKGIVLDTGCFSGCNNLDTITLSDNVTAIGSYAFQNSKVGSITIPSSVHTIGSYAFHNSKLTSITIPASVTSIETGAFQDNELLTTFKVAKDGRSSGLVLGAGALLSCDNLTTTELEGVIEFGKNCFAKCTKLTSITIPSTITSMSTQVFLECTALSDVTIADGATALGTQTFHKCSALKNISIPASVTSCDAAFNQNTDITSAELNCATIGANMFNGATKLTTVTFGDTVTSIGNSAFMNSAITKAELPDSVTVLPQNVFQNCKSLTTFSGGDITSIGQNAFDGCLVLESIPLPDSLQSVGLAAFRNCKAITKAHVPASVTEIPTYMFSGCSSLAEASIGADVTKLNANAFAECSSLKEIVIPAAITVIESNMFSKCTSLEKVTFLGDVTYFKMSAFNGCSSLEYTIPNTVEKIENSVFEGCSKLDTAIPASVTSLGQNVFKNCTSLGKKCVVSIPTSITNIPAGTFQGCTSLPNYTIGSHITSIDANAFNGCTSFTSVSIPKNVQTLGNYAYANCPNVTEVYFYSAGISTGCNTIGSNAFQNCTALDNIVLPASLAKINNNAFAGCTALKTLSLPSNVGILGTAIFQGCSNLESINLSSTTVPTIDTNCFKDCTSLVEVNFPDTITKINASAFENCTSLSEIVLPGSLTAILGNAFKNCDSLEYVIIPPSVGEYGSSAFYGCDKLETALVLGMGVFTGKTMPTNFFYLCPELTVYCYPDAAILKTTDAQKIPVEFIEQTDGTYIVFLKKLTNITGVKKGDTVTVPVRVASEGKLSYKWFVKNPGDADFKEAGITTDTYTMTVTDATDGQYVYCEVTSTSSTDPSKTNKKVTDTIFITTFGAPSPAASAVKYDSVTLSWKSVPGADSYTVYRADTLTGTKKELKTLTDTTFTDTSVAVGKTYYYFVEAASTALDMTSGVSEALEVTIPEPGKVAENVKAVADDGKVTITWDAVYNATQYRVRRNDGKSWTTVATVNTTSYVDTAVTNGTKYTYSIIACVNGTWCDPSAFVTATPNVVKVVPPASVSAESESGKITLSWSEVTGATAYRVRRHDGTAWATVATVTDLSYVDTAVKNGTKYTYGILAQVKGTWSAASVLVPVTAGTPVVCAAPTGVKASAGDSTVTVTWNAVNGATAYRVRRNDGKAWATLGNVTTTSYKDTAVTNGTKYTYGILAYVNGAWSAASTLVAATPVSAYECVPPTGVKATAGDKTVTVTWNAVPGATAYRVRRNDGKAWATLGNVTTTSYKDTAVTNGTKYTYGIFAQVNGTWSAAPALVTATPTGSYQCVPPTGVKAVGDDGVVTVTWNAVEGATAYRVRRNDGKAWATLGNVTATSYKDTAVTNGTKYTYGIFAQVNGTWSAASTLVTATPEAIECVPPASVTIKSESGKISLEWSAVNGATKYRVRRSDGSGWTNLASVSGTSYTDTAVTNGTNYVYGIFAYVDGAWSAASALVQAKPAAVVSGVANGLTIVTEADSITLSWDVVDGAEKYRVRRSDGVAWETKQTSAKTTFVDTDVVAGTTYKYSIYCYSNGAFGAPSSTVAAIL